MTSFRAESSSLAEQATCGVRSFSGSWGMDLWAHLAPEDCTAGAKAQATSIELQLEDLLAGFGATAETIVRQTIFSADVQRDRTAVLEARRARGSASARAARARAPIAFVEQPPLAPAAGIATLVQLFIPAGGRSCQSEPLCGAEGAFDPSAPTGSVLTLGYEKQLHAFDIGGSGDSAEQEAASAFSRADDLLRRNGLDFHSVARTWIYLRDMDADYAALNRARSAFFREQGIRVRPASTGIGGSSATPGRRFSLGLYAKSPGWKDRRILTTPALCEAAQYGAEFARGMAVTDCQKTTLYISGTASVGEDGKTLHVGQLEAQVRRMLANVESLLRGADASFSDVVSAVTYVRDASDAGRVQSILEELHVEPFPNTIVHARVCRPELLCEMEAVAVQPEFRPSRPAL